jgi:glycosyltransferase involved in cell wall biosynthesis
VKHVAVVRQYYFPLDPRVAREVAALRDAGFAVDVICLRRDGEPPREQDGAVRITRLGLRKRRGGPLGQLLEYATFLVAAAALLTVRHLRRPYDVIQVNTLPDVLVFAALLPRLLGARVVLDLHECMPEFFAVKFGVSSRHPLVRLVAAAEQASIRFAHQAITCTPLMKEAFVARGADARKIVVVQNSANEDVFARDRHAPRPHPGEFRIICHGSIEPLYGIDTGVRALALLAERHPQVHLRVVGEGSQRPELQALARELGVADRVSFSDGFVPIDDLLAEIVDADAGLVAMRRNPFRDLTLCNKMFDYVSMGVPALVSRTSSVEQVYDERDFLLFESDDPADLAERIAQLVEDPSMGDALARHALATTEPLRWPHQRARYVEVLRAAAAGALPWDPDAFRSRPREVAGALR